RLPGADAALDTGAVDDLRAGRLERDAHDRAEDELLGELLGGGGEFGPFEGLALPDGAGFHVVHHGGAADQPAGGGRQQHRPGEQRPRPRPRRRAPGARYRPSCPPPHDPASRPRGRSSSSASEASQSTCSASATVRIEPSISTGIRWLVMPVVISTPRPPPPPKVARVAVLM